MILILDIIYCYIKIWHNKKFLEMKPEIFLILLENLHWKIIVSWNLATWNSVYGFSDISGNICIRTKSHGSLFNLPYVKAKTKKTKKNNNTDILLRELFFVNDFSTVVHSETTLQFLVNNLNRACLIYFVVISVTKTYFGLGKRLTIKCHFECQ